MFVWLKTNYGHSPLLLPGEGEKEEEEEEEEEPKETDLMLIRDVGVFMDAPAR